jgi:hypothetical protein
LLPPAVPLEELPLDDDKDVKLTLLPMAELRIREIVSVPVKFVAEPVVVRGTT